MSMIRSGTYTLIVVLAFLVSGCATVVDTGISGIWAEENNGRFVMLSPNGEYCLGRNNTIGFNGSYSVDSDGKIHLVVPDAMFSIFYKVSLSRNGSVLTIEDIGGKKTELFVMKVQN